MTLSANQLKELFVNNLSYSNRSWANQVALRLEKAPRNIEFFIYSQLISNKSLLMGRLGGIEANCIGLYLDRKQGYRKPIRVIAQKFMISRRRFQLMNNAGVYPNTNEMFDFFCEEHLLALESVDIFSVWAKPFSWVESLALKNRDAIFTTGDFSYPWFDSRDNESEFGWGYGFEGKKILVVSPFAQSISLQIEKFDLIFPSKRLPKISFEILQAPLSQGGLADGLSYKDHLIRLKNEMSDKEFDIALISAGAYSLPLAAHAKSMGKTGIHGGGATQLFFGITGSRYDSYEQVKKYANQHWKRPDISERPKNWQTIEDGCYW